MDSVAVRGVSTVRGMLTIENFLLEKGRLYSIFLSMTFLKTYFTCVCAVERGKKECHTLACHLKCEWDLKEGHRVEKQLLGWSQESKEETKTRTDESNLKKKSFNYMNILIKPRIDGTICEMTCGAKLVT